MAAEMRRDADVFLIGEEVGQYQGAYKISQGLLDEFGPKRVMDMPITEHGFTGMAVGAAFTGLKPIVEFMTFNFSMQAIDQIINSPPRRSTCPAASSAARSPSAAPTARRAASPPSTASATRAGTRTAPGLKVVAPWSAADAKGLLRASIRDPNPVIFLENEILYGQSFDCPTDEDFISRSARRRSSGRHRRDHRRLLDHGRHGDAGGEKLAEQGISAEVINLRTIRPLDTETIVNSVRKTNRLVTLEEGWPFAGIGSEVAMQVMEHAFDHLDAPPARVTGLDVPMPYAANLEKLALPRLEQVVEAVRQVTYR
jgi:pyruvate dehydrogenase E1 component beta subunit